jgi:hypothetical protein
MAWLCLKDKALSGSQMCIVTGPRIDLAITLIDRMKRLFVGKGLIITPRMIVSSEDKVSSDKTPENHAQNSM